MFFFSFLVVVTIAVELLIFLIENGWIKIQIFASRMKAAGGHCSQPLITVDEATSKDDPDVHVHREPSGPLADKDSGSSWSIEMLKEKVDNFVRLG